jgi:hypothetical protein
VGNRHCRRITWSGRRSLLFDLNFLVIPVALLRLIPSWHPALAIATLILSWLLAASQTGRRSKVQYSGHRQGAWPFRLRQSRRCKSAPRSQRNDRRDRQNKPIEVIAAAYLVAARAARAATRTVPIVFVTGSDPVAADLVSSLNRPTGNVTGVAFMFTRFGSKNLEILQELVPNAALPSVTKTPPLP